MQSSRWLYEVKFANATLTAVSARDFARIAVFAYWYKQARADRQPITCRGFRLAQPVTRLWA